MRLEKRGRREVGAVTRRADDEDGGAGGRAWGRLSRFALLAGNRDESPSAAGLLSGLSFGALLADGGFDSDRLRALVASLGAEAVVPPASNRKEPIDCDMERYGRRHRMESFFCKIKRFRRIATRYDQTESSYSAMMRMAAVWLALA